MTRDVLVLRALRLATEHLHASQLEERVKLSSAELRQSIAELVAAGFDIEKHPHLGYRLRSSPDRLLADDLRARFAPEKLGPSFVREIIVLAETASTNDIALQLGRAGAEGGVAVFAEKQTAGRGRFGRAWESAARKGLWLSLLLRPSLPVPLWPRLTTWAAVGLARAITETTGCAARIKWPNDIVIEKAKVAGILAEIGVDDRGGRFAVLGLGINANHGPTDFSPEVGKSATSLALASGCAVDRSALAVALLEELAGSEAALIGDFGQIIKAATRLSSLLGQTIEARAGETIYRGVAEELDDDGHLMLRTPDGELLKLTAGEVTLAR